MAAALTMLVAGGAQAAAPEQPIKIGAFFALSGPAAPIGTPTKLVAEMAVDQINKAGGINGRPLELMIGDTESDPAKAATIAKKFIYADKVAAIIGPTSTGEGMQVKKIVEEAGIPIFMTVGGDPPIMKETGPYTYIFKSAPALLRGGQKALCVPQRQETDQRGAAERLRPLWQGRRRLAGKTGPGIRHHLCGQGVFRSQRHGHDPPAHQDQERQSPGHHLLDHRPGRGHCRQKQGPTGPHHSPVSVSRPTGPGIYPTGRQGLRRGPHARHETDGGRPLPDNDPQKKVIQNFIKLYQDTYHYDKQFPINTHSGYAWDAISMVAEGMRKAGTDPKALRAAIEGTQGYVGISGIYTLSPEDHNGLEPDSMVIIAVKDGKFELAK